MMNNGAVKLIATNIRHVMSSASKSEVAALFILGNGWNYSQKFSQVIGPLETNNANTN